ncbi:MAG: hypothetical protein JKY43_04615 [Phycisphaerales bacterium]|nr:hypothetical protein [Phycisphaerales bacterium]
MRILTKKIHRAYPELDQFDDKTCKRFITRAKQRHGAWKANAFLVFVLVTTFILWIPLAILLGFLERKLALILGYGDALRIPIMLMLYTGIGWFPSICFLLSRDRLLHLAIRTQLQHALCRNCGYSLLGLTLTEHHNQQAVQCPECGQTTTLKELDLTQADIDPTLLSGEPRS